MKDQLLAELETAILKRNSLLAEKLRPGLPEARIRRNLDRAKIQGAIEPLIRLYSWRDGTVLDRDLASSKTGFFPNEIYQFTYLERAIADFHSFSEAVEYHPRIGEAVGRYFPPFWDGSTGWLAIDLDPSSHNRIMMIEFESDEPFRQIYASFEEFLLDGIRANREDDTLTCFQ